MRRNNYPVRKKKNVHTTIGVGIWKEITRIAKANDVPKAEVVNTLLAFALTAQPTTTKSKKAK